MSAKDNMPSKSSLEDIGSAAVANSGETIQLMRRLMGLDVVVIICLVFRPTITWRHSSTRILWAPDCVDVVDGNM